MMREYHVRFRERFRGETPLYLLDYKVELDGTVSNVKISGTPNSLLGEAVLKVVESSPKWEPAKNAANAITYNSQVTIKFEKPGNVFNDANYFVVEEMPHFPGGDQALLKYIAENLKYPPEAREQKIQGKVIVRFIVNRKGKSEDISILKSANPLLDAEAIRVVSTVPDFKPGSQGGKPVNVSYMIPVNFKLQ
jgi:TonB family protein